MNYREVKRDIFEYNPKIWSYAHCVSSCLKMGAGIAVQFQKKFCLRQAIIDTDYKNEFPHCVFVKNVFNLITKEKYYHKPTYLTLSQALEVMRCQVIDNDIENIVMPKIGCGLDKLKWNVVSPIIQNMFEDIDVEIVVCYL